MSGRSVNLTTLFLGRLKPPKRTSKEITRDKRENIKAADVSQPLKTSAQNA